jgi:uncharacterized protein (DUF1800 family)
VVDVGDLEHLLRRTEFVARPERVQALVAGTLEQAVDDVLAVPPGAVPIPPEIAQDVAGMGWEQYVFASHWWYERMARTSARPIQEKMAMFWHGHFCSEWGKVDSCAWMMQQNALFRDQGLGNLRTLAQAMAIQPAMLVYLDNAENVKTSPNQNFARELLELFLLGVGNYTESDVDAATKAWTGHGIDWTTEQYLFRPTRHDTSAKTFLGRTVDDGPEVIATVLGPDAVIAVGPNAGLPARVVAARFLSKKLWEAFAAASPPASVVHALADVLVANDFEIRPWLRAMLLRSEFYEPAARQGLVRTPTEYIVAVLYDSGLPAAVAHPEWWNDEMGQALFHPPNVSGWKINGYWVNAGAMAARAAFAGHVRWTLLGTRDDTPPGPLVLRGGSWSWSALDAMTPETLVDTITAAFRYALAPTTRAALVSWAQGEQRTWGPDWWRSANVVLLAMIVPEMSVA